MWGLMSELNLTGESTYIFIGPAEQADFAKKYNTVLTHGISTLSNPLQDLCPRSITDGTLEG